MIRPGFLIDRADGEDMTAIMALEHSGFAPEIVEDRSVFQARLDTFPEGFVVLRDADTGRARGYLATERWAGDPGSDRTAFLLSHDPAPRYSPTGSVLYIASMTIEPALRGSGLGVDLFRHGRDRILSAAPEIRLELLIVHEHWQGARRIYESEGFRVRSKIREFFPAAAARRRDGEPTEDRGGAHATLMERQVA